MTYEDIYGWFDFQSTYDQAVANAEPDGILVEIGSYMGKSTAYLASKIIASGKSLRFYAVDPWDQQVFKEVFIIDPGIEFAYEKFLDNMKKCNVLDAITPLRMFSVDAAQQFRDGTVDFVFIDGNHAYDFVKADLETWWPKIRAGGIIAGHDYDHPEFPGVKQAVDEWLTKTNLPISIIGQTFVIKKPQVAFAINVYKEPFRQVGHCLRRIKKAVPHAVVKVFIDGERRPDVMKLAKKLGYAVHNGEHLGTNDTAALWWKRMLSWFRAVGASHCFKIDPDTMVLRNFILPKDDYFGMVEQSPKGGPYVQGGVTGLSGSLVRTLLDSNALDDPTLSDTSLYFGWTEPVPFCDDQMLGYVLRNMGCLPAKWLDVLSRHKEQWLPEEIGTAAMVHPVYITKNS